MWVLLPVQSTLLWTTLDENEYFVLQEHKAARTMLQGVMNSFRSALGGEKHPYSYRIVLKSRGGSSGASWTESLINEGGGSPPSDRDGGRHHDHHQNHHQHQHQHQHHPHQSQRKKAGTSSMENSGEHHHHNPNQLRTMAAAVAAVGDDEAEIREHWRYLKDQLLPALEQFDQSLRSEEAELRRFLQTKMAGLALRERERQKKEKEDLILMANGIARGPEADHLPRHKRFRDIHRASKVLQASKQAPWLQHFPELARFEELTFTFRCVLLRRSERRGRMFVSGRHVCFYGRSAKLVLPWAEVSSVARTVAANGAGPAIYFATPAGDEFVFYGFKDRDYTLQMLREIWRMTLDNLACKLTADFDIEGGPISNQLSTSRSALPSPSIPVGPSPRFSEPVSPRFSSPPSPLITVAMTLTSQSRSLTKEMLQAKIERDIHRKMFRLSTDENLINRYQATLWMTSFYHQGVLSISPNFACFHSAYQGEVFTVVINFRDVEDVSIVDGRLILLQTRKNKFSLSFLARRKHAYELLHSTWSSNRWLVSQESLPQPPPPPPFANNFVGPDASMLNNPEQFRPDYKERMRKQKEQWDQYINKNGWGGEMIITSHLAELVRDGIPDEYRGMLWQRFSGSIFSVDCKRGEYQNILKIHQGQQSLATSEIARDVHRSFPEHPYFQSKAGRDALQRVLSAYSWRNQTIGYCQSMNIICALLLLYMSEEEAFWVLRMLCEEYMPGYWTPDMVGSITDQRVFEDLVEEYLPEIDAHLSSIDLPLALVSFPWFVCIFIGYFPMEVGLRILDILFFEGFESTFMFKAGLAMLKLHQNEVLEQVDGLHACGVLKRPSVECDSFLEIACNDFNSITREKVEEIRDHHRSLMLKEMEENKAKEKECCYSPPLATSPVSPQPVKSGSSFKAASPLRSAMSASTPELSKSPGTGGSPPQPKREITLADIMSPSPPEPSTTDLRPRASSSPYSLSRTLRSSSGSLRISASESASSSPHSSPLTSPYTGSPASSPTSSPIFRFDSGDKPSQPISPRSASLIPKLQLGKLLPKNSNDGSNAVEADKISQPAATSLPEDNPPKGATPEPSLEQILEQQIELPVSKPGQGLTSKKTPVVLRKRSFSTTELVEKEDTPWKQLMRSRITQSGNGSEENSGSSEERSIPPSTISGQDKDLMPSIIEPSSEVLEIEHKGGEDRSGSPGDVAPPVTRARANSTTTVGSPTRRPASNSQRILDVITIAQQVGSKAIADDSVKAVDMVRQLRIQEINQLRSSLKRMPGGKSLRRMATMDASQLIQVRASRMDANRPARGHKRDHSVSGMVSRSEQDPTLASTIDQAQSKDSEDQSTPLSDAALDSGERHIEESKMSLSNEGIKGKVEDGEGESDDEEELDASRDADKPEDDVDSNNLQYVQNFLLRSRKSSDLRFSLTKRLQGPVGSTTRPPLLHRGASFILMQEDEEQKAKEEQDERAGEESSDDEDEDEGDVSSDESSDEDGEGGSKHSP